MTEVLPGKLYLSGLAPVSEENLKKCGISVIIRVLDTEPVVEMKDIITHWYQVDDFESESHEIRKYFDAATDVINEAITSEKKVLVHCRAGVSRSATIVLCYLMKYEKKSLIEAHTFLKEKRKLIRPNLGFWSQLVDFEYSLHGENTVKMVEFKEGWGKIPDIYSEQFENLY
jgi:atypical dual specificity phosphatase